MPYWPSTYYKICVIHRLSQESRVHISNIHFINKLKKIPLVSSMNDASDWVFFTQIYFLKKNLHTIFTLNIIFVLFHEWKKMRTIIEKNTIFSPTSSYTLQLLGFQTRKTTWKSNAMDLPSDWWIQKMTCDFSRRLSGTTGNDGKVKKWPESQGQPAG